MDENKKIIEELKEGLKITIVLFIIPVFSLMFGISFIMDEIFLFFKNKREFTSIINVYYFQLLMMYIVVPIIIYYPFNRKLFFGKKQTIFNTYSVILSRYVLGGNLLFFSSLVSIISRFYTFELTHNLTWGDIKCIIIPFCIGFVFFYNNFLKNRINE